MITMKLVGMDDVSRNVDMLGAAVRDKVIKKAMRKCATPIKNEAQALAPEDSGTLKESIGINITSKGAKGNWIRCYIGPRSGIQMPLRIVGRGGQQGLVRVAIPTRYAHLVEFGHRIVINGEYIGDVAPVPFMRGAWDRHGGEVALNVFEVECSKGVDEEIAKLPDSAFKGRN
jgi:HK97 gp10 family phage protein